MGDMRQIFVEEKPQYGRGLLKVLIVLVGIAAVVGAGIYLVGLVPEDVVPVSVDETMAPVPDADMARLDSIEFDADLPRTAIPEAAATDAATSDFDPGELGASRVDAYLATITVASTEQALTPITDSDVWIVKLSGMAVPRPGSPPGEDGSVPTYSTVYVFLDAQTGDVLFAEWYE
jgi:hypothetical protein